MRKQKQPLGPFVLWTPGEGGIYRKSWESAPTGEATIYSEGDLAAFEIVAAYAAAGLVCLVDVRQLAGQEAGQ